MTKEEKSNDFVSVLLPSDLADRIKKRLSSIEFESTSDYVIYALEQFLLGGNVENYETKDAFSNQEQEVVEKRLKELGYE
jgi:Arc/MetJ-type ribon-helix-helix transcriptional regulator